MVGSRADSTSHDNPTRKGTGRRRRGADAGEELLEGREGRTAIMLHAVTVVLMTLRDARTMAAATAGENGPPRLASRGRLKGQQIPGRPMPSCPAGGDGLNCCAGLGLCFSPHSYCFRRNLWFCWVWDSVLFTPASSPSVPSRVPGIGMKMIMMTAYRRGERVKREMKQEKIKKNLRVPGFS